MRSVGGTAKTSSDPMIREPNGSSGRAASLWSLSEGDVVVIGCVAIVLGAVIVCVVVRHKAVGHPQAVGVERSYGRLSARANNSAVGLEREVFPHLILVEPNGVSVRSDEIIERHP